MTVYIIAEIGINHNGDEDIARSMVEDAIDCGADAVKFQKRDVETVYGRAPYPPGYLDQPRKHPLGGEQTQRGQKTALELDAGFIAEIAFEYRRYIDVGVSCWDEKSLSTMASIPAIAWLKIASPCVLDRPLVDAHLATDKRLIASTGMLTDSQVRDLSRRLPDGSGLLQCTSAYPCPAEDTHVGLIPEWKKKYPHLSIGYSGHESGYYPTLAAVALGAEIVERHFTLDKTMYGSDQSASLSPGEFKSMVAAIREVEASLNGGGKRPLYCEKPAIEKLRRVVE